MGTDLRVETGSRLVKEKKELGLRSEFNTDSQEFPLFHVKTLARNTNNRLGKVSHVEHLDDLLNIVELFLLANRRWLSKHGGELQCLADSRGFKMEIPNIC